IYGLNKLLSVDYMISVNSQANPVTEPNIQITVRPVEHSHFLQLSCNMSCFQATTQFQVKTTQWVFSSYRNRCRSDSRNRSRTHCRHRGWCCRWSWGWCCSYRDDIIINRLNKFVQNRCQLI